MTNPLVGFSGLASGVQWQDVVERSIAIDRSRKITPLTNRQSLLGRQRTAWNDLTTLLGTFQKQLAGLTAGTAFSTNTVTGGASALTGRTLLSATAAAGATPGTYDVEVRSLARAEKLAGAVQTSATTALGLAGSFSVGGQTVSVEATDTLEGVRDRINALNTGATPSGVSASILQAGTGNFRLVLTAATPGATGIALTDGAAGVAADLGFVANRSRTVSSATAAIAATLGVSMPPPSTVRVGNQVISVDLTTDSILSIVSKIRAARGEASIEEVTVGGDTQYRLVVGGSVTATGDAGSQDVIDMLQFSSGGTRAAAEQLTATGVLGDGGGSASMATLLTDLSVDGAGLGLAVGDTITIRGSRGDRSSVLTGITIGAGDTLQTLLDKLNGTDAFGGGTRTATATLGPDGRIRLVDNVGGDSELSVSFDVQRAAGGATTLGTVTTDVEGRTRQVAAGSDAVVVVDGVTVRGAGNSVATAIPGVTLNLLQAEAGTTVSVTVGRDNAAATKAVEDLVSSYNDVVAFFDRQQAEGQALRQDPTLRGIVRSLTEALRTVVPDAGTYSRGAEVGMTLGRDGRLSLDSTAFAAAMAGARDDLAALFSRTGIAGALDTVISDATRVGTGTISSTLSSIEQQSSTLATRITREEEKLEDRRARMVEQYSRMEAAIARFGAQASYLSSQLSSWSQKS